MRLDDVRLARCGAGRLDDVRVDRALRQPLDVLELVRLLVEHLDELAPMILRFSSGSRLAGQRGEEALGRVDPNDVDAQMLGERLP